MPALGGGKRSRQALQSTARPHKESEVRVFVTGRAGTGWMRHPEGPDIFLFICNCTKEHLRWYFTSTAEPTVSMTATLGHTHLCSLAVFHPARCYEREPAARSRVQTAWPGAFRVRQDVCGGPDRNKLHPLMQSNNLHQGQRGLVLD